MKVGLLLEGGAMRGLYTAGVLDVLLAENIKVDDIFGVSAGALFGINYKSKQGGRVLRYNQKYASCKEYMGLYSLLKTGNIMNKEFCFDKLVHELDPFDFETYQKSDENFYVAITNMLTGQAEYHMVNDLNDPQQLEYLRASGSMPFVSRPVVINHIPYLDGGVADSIPIEKMLSLGYDKIIVVLTRVEDYRKIKSPTLLPRLFYHHYPDFLYTINHRYKRYNAQLDLISKLQLQQKIMVIRPSHLVDIKRLETDSQRMQEMYDLGKEDTYDQLSSLKKYLNQ